VVWPWSRKRKDRSLYVKVRRKPYLQLEELAAGLKTDPQDAVEQVIDWAYSGRQASAANQPGPALPGFASGSSDPIDSIIAQVGPVIVQKLLSGAGTTDSSGMAQPGGGNPSPDQIGKQLKDLLG